MFTNTMIAQEFVDLGWECPYCINRCIESLKTLHKMGHTTVPTIDAKAIRIFDEVSRDPYGAKATQLVHAIENHPGVVWNA